MKTWSLILLIAIGMVLAASTSAQAAAQNAARPVAQAATAKAVVPKYDAKTEAAFKGTIIEVRDRICPVSGGLGSHIVIRMADGKTIEAHLATTKFVNSFDLTFHKGEEVTIVGSKVNFEGVETIFAREVTRGQEVFMFRDKDGAPAW
jgi:hypothetical protein